MEENNDVCAICYQDMTSAKLTRCNHFFHGVCLRKWLYVQDTCPLCHATLYKHLLGKQQQKQQPDAGERVPGDVAASPAEQQQNLPPAQPQRAGWYLEF